MFKYARGMYTSGGTDVRSRRVCLVFLQADWFSTLMLLMPVMSENQPDANAMVVEGLHWPSVHRVRARTTKKCVPS